MRGSRRLGTVRAAAALAAALALGSAAPARGQLWTRPAPPASEPPSALEGVGVDEQLGAPVPLDVELLDGEGRTYRFASAFDGHRPVVLALVYYDCPMLCGLILSGAARAMRENGLLLGKDFQAVTVSFDPRERPAQAAERRRGYLQSMGLGDAGWEWPFLVGSEAASRRLADAVGFHYKYDEARREWAHMAAIFVLTPDGRVSRYLYGIEFAPKDLRLALVEAADGKVGTSLDRLLLTCYRWDPASRKYEPYAWGFLRAGGALVLVALAGLIAGLVLRERRMKATHAP